MRLGIFADGHVLRHSAKGEQVVPSGHGRSAQKMHGRDASSVPPATKSFFEVNREEGGLVDG